MDGHLLYWRQMRAEGQESITHVCNSVHIFTFHMGESAATFPGPARLEKGGGRGGFQRGFEAHFGSTGSQRTFRIYSTAARLEKNLQKIDNSMNICWWGGIKKSYIVDIFNYVWLSLHPFNKYSLTIFSISVVAVMVPDLLFFLTLWRWNIGQEAIIVK